VKVALVDFGTPACEGLGTALARHGVLRLRPLGPVDAVCKARALGLGALILDMSTSARLGNYTFASLRLDPETAPIPVVCLVDQSCWGRRANDADADAIVPRPWTAERVSGAVRRVLARNGSSSPTPESPFAG